MEHKIREWLEALEIAVRSPSLCAEFPPDPIIVPAYAEGLPAYVAGGATWSVAMGDIQMQTARVRGYVFEAGRTSDCRCTIDNRASIIHAVAVTLRSLCHEYVEDEALNQRVVDLVAKATRRHTVIANRHIHQLAFRLTPPPLVRGVGLTVENILVIDTGDGWETLGGEPIASDELATYAQWQWEE